MRKEGPLAWLVALTLLVGCIPALPAFGAEVGTAPKGDRPASHVAGDDDEPKLVTVRFVVKGKTWRTRTRAVGKTIGRLPRLPAARLAKGEMFVGWQVAGKRIRKKTTVTRPMTVTAGIKRGPKPARLLQSCPAGSWGRDAVYGDRWVCFEGRVVDPDLARVLPYLEADLRASGLVEDGLDLGDYFVQGAYHTGFGASGGTHDRGGVVDLDPRLGSRKGLTILRRWALAAWRRPAGTVSSIDHVHAVLIGSHRLTPRAKGQVESYRAGGDGLGGGVDTGPRPKKIESWKTVLKRAVKRCGQGSKAQPVARCP